jgi:putative PDZ domain protein
LIHLLHPSSKPSTALSERELAYAFGGYSPEDQESTEQVLPFTFSSNATFDWSQAKTFAFAPSSSGDKSLDDALYGRIAQLLETRGLRQQSSSPDLVIQSLYTLDRSAGLHFQLQVARPGSPDDILWRAESMELAPTASTMDSYAREVLPLVLYAFPYIPTAERPSYRKDTRRYLYTGILYDKHDLSRIADVEDASPAFVAGLRSGDRILRIGGKALTPTSLEALSEKYRDFLSDTYKHRIQLRDGSGGHAWAQGSYGSIKKALEREKYAAVFSYLFAFRPYVDDAKTTELSFEVERDGERYTLSIQPLLRDESTLIPQ